MGPPTSYKFISSVITPFATGTSPPCSFHSLRIRLDVLEKDLNLESYSRDGIGTQKILFDREVFGFLGIILVV